jgi:hypothetical protein
MKQPKKDYPNGQNPKMDNFVFSSRIGLKPLFVNLFSS